MTVLSMQESRDKSDRALVLHEQGLRRAEIVERLGVKPTNIAGMLQRARQRREKNADEVRA
jgi:DNA-binding transcriptional regulator LsrR (DeoR family)